MINDIKDIKPPIEIPSQWAWIWPVLGVAAACALLVWFVVWYWRRPKAKKETVVVVSLSAWEKAYKRLDNLLSKGLMQRADLKQFYSDLSDIVRHYLEERFSLRAPEMTTEEFLNSLKTSSVLNEEQKQTLKEFLMICDMVKFAKHQSSVQEAQESFDLAKQLIDQTHGI